MTAPVPKDRLLRLIVQQAALPKYRVPVFRELANRPGIQLKVFYSDVPGLSNVEPSGFDAAHVPIRRWNLLGHPFYWHRPQWTCAAPKHADVLILSWDLHYLSLVPSLLRAKANGLPTILWGHGYSKREAAWRSFPRRKVAQLATALLFYNHTTAQAYIDAGWDPDRIYVALNSLDQTPIQQARQHWLARPQDLHDFQQKESLTPGPVILFVSRLDADNQVNLLLEAASHLTNTYPHLRIIIIGKGADEHRLRQLAAFLDIERHVRFLGAIYDEQNLAPWFLSSNLFCYPANIGLSILHAFGYGLPIVTNDRMESQNPEIEAIQNGRNGLLYAHGDVSALVNALARILRDRDLAHQMSDEALKTATQRFTLQNMVDGFEAAARYCAERGQQEHPDSARQDAPATNNNLKLAPPR